MPNQIEARAPWPISGTHTRVAYLEKEAAAIREVMSYRPLAITAPIYRCWATMRLATMEEWIGPWALPEMHAGVHEMGAVDAWHKALNNIEEVKINATPFCGGVADIAKFSDRRRRRRGIVYKMASAAGMPTMILRAYEAYIENLLLYNCHAGGVGRPHRRKCCVPQGCPFSIMMVALMMRPWISYMRAFGGVQCLILADDILIVAEDDRLVRQSLKCYPQVPPSHGSESSTF